MAYEPVSLDPVKVETFLTEVQHELQRERSLISTTLNNTGVPSGNIVHWPTMGQIGKPGPKSAAGLIPTSGYTTSRKTVAVTPEYNGVYEDDFDQVLVNFSVRQNIIKALRWSIDRWTDDKIISILDTATKEIDGSTGTITLAQVRGIVAYFDEQNVPGRDRFVAVSPGVFTDLMEIPQFANGDWTNAKEWADAGIDARRWLGMTWYAMNGLPKSGDVVSCFAYARMAVGWHLMDPGSSIKVDWIPERASWLLSYRVAGNGIILHEPGVVRLKVRDTVSSVVT